MSAEQIIRMPSCFHCYRPHGKAPPPSPAPYLTKGFVTYALLSGEFVKNTCLSHFLQACPYSSHNDF